MAIDATNLIDLVITPTLNRLGMASPNSVQLVASTIAHESSMGTYLAQNSGPALGIAQMEPVTHDDIWTNYLRYNPVIVDRIIDATWIVRNSHEPPPSEYLLFNLKYAVAMCRIAYYRHPEPLPNYGDMEGMANYWKKYYNTPQGAGTIEQFIASWKQYLTTYHTTHT